MAKSIKQSVTFNAAPKVIYKALMDSKQHAEFTGAKAKIGSKVGEPIAAHGKHISGFNVELVPGKRVVQAWRGSDWEDGAYSIVTFALAPAANGSTKVTFTQYGVPEANYAGIKQGWKDYYWKPLKAWLASK